LKTTRGDLADPHWPALLDADGATRLHELLAGGGDHLALDVGRHPLGLLVIAVQEEPPWTLRDLAAHQEDAEAHERGETEGQAPADVHREEGGVEQDERRQRAEDGADPVRAADDEVHGARTRAGMSSSTAEWMAEYSPPTPAPVITRHAMNHTKPIENAVRTLPARKMPSLSMKRRLRPILSARRPK
jgi:hypothetical protein